MSNYLTQEWQFHHGDIELTVRTRAPMRAELWERLAPVVEAIEQFVAEPERKEAPCQP